MKSPKPGVILTNPLRADNGRENENHLALHKLGY